jgi:3-phenylpropionate/cinnamic acid dioxygenase small subunit
LITEIASSELPAGDTALLDALNGAYAAALDSQNWQGWIDLFTPDCSYAVYSLENVDAGLPLGYMIDDRHERLVDRVKFITEVWATTIEAYRTRHVIQRVATTRDADGTYRVRANVLVGYTESNGTPGMLVCGYYDDVVRMTADGPRFVRRTVYLDGTPARYLAYPL